MAGVDGKLSGVQPTMSAVSSIPSLIRQAGEAAMTEGLEILSTTLRTDFLQGPYPTEIERRSGRFRASFKRGDKDNIFRVKSEGTKIVGTLGSQDVRAHILDQGGTIRPTRSQFLAIRTDFTLTGRGVVREKYRGPLRGLPNTFVQRTRSGKLGVFEKFGKRIELIAVLVKSVFIRGRHFMDKGVSKATPAIVEHFNVRFQAVFTRLNDTLRKLGR